MKPRLPLLAAVLGAALFGGCNTYHYYDIDVKFMSPVTETQVSVMKLCLVDVSGAASDTLVLDCPPAKFPDLGTFEYATFADSGTITFTFNGFYDLPQSSSNQCTSSPTSLTASDQITQTGTITITDFNTTNCPLSVTP
ncbi:MAG TPA: hypothetical protein VLA79_17870 [Polyangia bacterium]|nr:hypothetical protein [Polyangia bacterium]